MCVGGITITCIVILAMDNISMWVIEQNMFTTRHGVKYILTTKPIKNNKHVYNYDIHMWGQIHI